MTLEIHNPRVEPQAVCDTLLPEATTRASHGEIMARRRFQSPTPRKEGKFWWLRVWDSSLTGSRKRQRLKLAPADTPVREVQKIAAEKLRPVNQGLVLTGAAMNFGDFVTDIYEKTYLPLLSSSTQDSYSGVISKYLEPEFLRLSLRDLTRLTVQQYFSGMAATVPYPTISKIRDALSSILRSAVDADYLIKNPLDGLRLPLDKRPRQPKPTITPEQFHSLLELVPEPYASMLFVSVWTGLRISELIGLKWRCIHAESITVEERFCRGDWSTPKTSASAATIGVAPQVIARITRLKSLTVEVRAGRAVRKHKLVKSAGPDDLVFQSVKAREADEGSKHFATAYQTGSQSAWDAIRQLALFAHVPCNVVGTGRCGCEKRTGSDAAFPHSDHDGHLRADRSTGATPDS